MTCRIESVLVPPIVAEPLSLDDAKLRAGLDWVVGDPRDDLMTGFIAAARGKVEHDTGLALPTQSRDLMFDALPTSIYLRDLPDQSLPLQSVTSLTWYDSAGAAHVLTPLTDYTVLQSNRTLSFTILTPPVDLRLTNGWTVRIVAGFAADALPPELLQAIGLLTAHYATTGRDLVSLGHMVADVPFGYEDIIAPFRIVSVM